MSVAFPNAQRLTAEGAAREFCSMHLALVSLSICLLVCETNNLFIQKNCCVSFTCEVQRRCRSGCSFSLAGEERISATSVSALLELLCLTAASRSRRSSSVRGSAPGFFSQGSFILPTCIAKESNFTTIEQLDCKTSK